MLLYLEFEITQIAKGEEDTWYYGILTSVMVLETSQYLFYYTHKNVASLRRVALNEKKDEQVGSELLVVFWTSHSTTHEQVDTIRNKHWCQLWYHSQNTQSCPGISWYLYGSPYFYFCIYFWLSVFKSCICVDLACSMKDHQWGMVGFCIDTWLYCFMIKSCDIIPKCFILFSNCQEYKGIQ